MRGNTSTAMSPTPHSVTSIANACVRAMRQVHVQTTTQSPPTIIIAVAATYAANPKPQLLLYGHQITAVPRMATTLSRAQTQSLSLRSALLLRSAFSFVLSDRTGRSAVPAGRRGRNGRGGREGRRGRGCGRTSSISHTFTWSYAVTWSPRSAGSLQQADVRPTLGATTDRMNARFDPRRTITVCAA